MNRNIAKRTVRYGLPAALIVLLGWLWTPSLLRGMGQWLVQQDPLEHASAIVVIGGGAPFRPMEAAEIYRGGWAPVVVVTKGAVYEEQLALSHLGIHLPADWEVGWDGVPESSLVFTTKPAEGTIEELHEVFRTLQPKNVPVILVTSKYHARRTRLTWSHVAGDQSKPIVRTARFDPFDADRWWKERRFALAVSREYLGLLNYWAGFPVQARADTE